MSDWTYVLGIVIAAVVGPLLISWQAGRRARAAEQRGYDREDAVAERLIASNALVAAKAEVVLDTIEVVHTLINSQYTAAKESELEETRSSLVLLVELAALHELLGSKPSAETLDVIEGKRRKIYALEALLVEREKQAAAVVDQVAAVADAKLAVGVAELDAP